MFHMEAVVPRGDLGGKEAAAGGGATEAAAPTAAGPSGAAERCADSIESLVRNHIQKMKTDMASEVIDAGRFDQRTSMDERRQTLEALLQVSCCVCVC